MSLQEYTPSLQPTPCRIRETTKAELGPDWEFVAGSVEEHTCHLTIDTGSNIYIILPGVYFLSRSRYGHACYE